MKKLDGLDSEAIRDMQRSRAWELFLERSKVLRDRTISNLTMDSDAQQTATFRGYIRGIDDVLTIPDTIVAEIKAKGGKHGKVDRGRNSQE